MSLIWPTALLSLAVVVALLIWYLVAVRRSARESRPLGPMRADDGATSAQRSARRHAPMAVLLLGLAVLSVGSARPAAVLDLPRFEGTVILAFDTSASMRADDVEPSRLDAAKALATEFAEAQGNDIRIGVVTFSSGGLVVQEPTLDHELVIEAIDTVSAEGFTSLGQGLFTALDALSEEPIRLDGTDPSEPPAEPGSPLPPIDPEGVDIGFFASAIVVVLSDGENTDEPDPLDVATIATNAGVRVYTVGIGTTTGAVIEVDGFQLGTALDDASLRAVAERTDGTYVEGPGSVDGAMSITDLGDRVDRELAVRGEETELTAIFAAVGAALLLLGAGLSMRRFGRAP